MAKSFDDLARDIMHRVYGDAADRQQRQAQAAWNVNSFFDGHQKERRGGTGSPYCECDVEVLNADTTGGIQRCLRCEKPLKTKWNPKVLA